MKNRNQELLSRMQRQYHRRHPWNLQGGLYIPHSYEEVQQDDLSWWDDVGFILNKRRVIVWWQHPRCVYSDAIDEQSWLEAGDGPQDNWFLDGAKKTIEKLELLAKRSLVIPVRSRPLSKNYIMSVWKISVSVLRLRVLILRFIHHGSKKTLAGLLELA